MNTVNIASTIDPAMTIDRIELYDGGGEVHIPINATHPYERVGRFVRGEIYARCLYRVHYASNRQFDTLIVQN